MFKSFCFGQMQTFGKGEGGGKGVFGKLFTNEILCPLHEDWEKRHGGPGYGPDSNHEVCTQAL